MNNLSEKEIKILKLIHEMSRKNGYSPTVREICSAMGFKSASTAHTYIMRLKEKGLVSNVPESPRTIKANLNALQLLLQQA